MRGRVENDGVEVDCKVKVGMVVRDFLMPLALGPLAWCKTGPSAYELRCVFEPTY